ncbi:hypothetical protein [Hymenobacter pini]|uniref:hypothetical protein n=1 Tax=Hymenobacter pini TaxID=2880879 RepID=UPI001CF4CE50|nr:hypothetical protein [Hymenobacter pini]MCA8831595.1 hypothetical protein [Hymenobacter pini]
MEADVTEYLIKYYSSLLTDTEHLALKHLQHNEKLLVNGDADSRERMREMYLRMNWLTNDARVLTLLQDGQEMFIQRAAQRIYAENGGEQLLNRCRACNRLARTPQARQCRYCNFDWH